MSSDITPEFVRALSAYTGVPEFMLSGDTIPAVWESAKAAVEWGNSTAPAAPPPPTAAVSASVPQQQTQITLGDLVGGDDVLTAWRQNRLSPMGAPQPPPRRNNGHTRTNEP